MPSYILYKPYQMLSQFTREAPHHRTLADLSFTFPKTVYPVGRLDADSEGLLLLTDDKSLNAKLLRPERKQPKTYWVQVEGAPTDADLAPLRSGVLLRIKGTSYRTLPAEVAFLSATPELPERHPPVRFRKSVPDAWLSITLVEGKNRQVRRMCAAIGFPVLRLVRVAVAGFRYGEGVIGRLEPGTVREVAI